MRRVSANKNVLSSRLNSVRQMSCCRSSAGRLFHSRGPAIPKLLSPSLDYVRGTVHVWTSADHRCRRPTSVMSWQSSDRYGGAMQWSIGCAGVWVASALDCHSKGPRFEPGPGRNFKCGCILPQAHPAHSAVMSRLGIYSVEGKAVRERPAKHNAEGLEMRRR